jgi:hypothetical protein
MANRTKLTEEKKAKFLDALKSTASVSSAAKAIGVSRTAIYELRKNDPVFAADFEAAGALATQRLEDEAIRRAFHGVRKPVYYQGEKVDELVEYSDTLLIFLLKGRDPERFAERAKVEHSGRIHQTVTHRAVSETDRRIGELFGLGESPSPTPSLPH